jgi:hypothetical protein
MNKRLLIAVFAALMGSTSLHATERILVASSRSNSIEEFNTSGTWLRTFATTGPYAPVALAQSPTNGDIFVTTAWASGPQAGQLTNPGKILRYDENGNFDVVWDTFTVACPNPISYPLCPTTQTQSLLFDSLGNLWVATAYGKDLGGAPIYIFEYLAGDLKKPNPPAQPIPIVASMYRGNQMAFNKSGDLCIAGFIDRDVQCFNTSTRAKTHDYSAEIVASGLSIAPGGLAFDGNDRMYLTDVFGGQVAKEINPGGPIKHLATLPSQLDGNLVLRGANLYTSTFNVSPPTFSTPDPVYEVSTSGIPVNKFIYEIAPPALGNDHIWGAYWMIFYCSDCF